MPRTDVGVYAILVTQMLGAFANMVVLPTLPFYALYIGGDAFDISLMMSAFNIGSMVCSPVVGTIADNIGSKQVLVIGAILQALSNTFLSLTADIRQLIFARALGGVALSTVAVEMSYIMNSVKGEKELTRILALQRILGSTGALLGPLIATTFASYGFNVLCWGVVAINVLSAILLCFFLSSASTERSPSIYEEDNEESEEEVNGVNTQAASDGSSSENSSEPRKESVLAKYWSMLSNGPTGITLFAGLLFTFGENVSGAIQPVLLKDEYGFEIKTMAFYFTCMNASSICWSLVVPSMMDCVGPTLFLVSSCLATGIMALTLPALTAFQYMPFLFAATCGLFGTMYALGFMHVVHRKCPEDMLGSFFGLQTSLNNLAGALGPPLGGCLYPFDNYAPFAVTAIASALASLAFFGRFTAVPSVKGVMAVLRRGGTLAHNQTYVGGLLALTTFPADDLFPPDANTEYDNFRTTETFRQQRAGERAVMATPDLALPSQSTREARRTSLPASIGNDNLKPAPFLTSHQWQELATHVPSTESAAA